MASCFAPVSISGGSHLKAREVCFTKSSTFGKTTSLAVQRKPMPLKSKFSVSAEYRYAILDFDPCEISSDEYSCFSYYKGSGNRGGGSDFVAGFLLGGAIFGTLSYIFAPQIRRSLLNEDEYGFRKAKRPIYYDEGLEKTRETLNEKINQLNSAIDNVSSRLRGGNKSSNVPVETDPEVETTM